MKYLHDEKENFSIRNWVEAKNENGFLFISSRADQHESLQPLISTWIDIAVKALLSVEQNNYADDNPRRIWIILDEIGSLQQLPSLLDGLAQSRQFGGAFILSLHSISQLKSIYGRYKTDTITSLCRNKLFFAGADDETSDYCSQNLGYQEIEEVKEGISYGANEIRDGVSLNHQKSLKRLVISSEIMCLKALQAYIKFAGAFPVAKVSFKVKNRDKIAVRFLNKDDISLITDKSDISVENKKEVEEKEETTGQLSLLDYIDDEDSEDADEEDNADTEDDSQPAQVNQESNSPPENPSADNKITQNLKKRRNIF
jgi:type IV secretory pathway TraG/TraD family ATPase VirD4